MVRACDLRERVDLLTLSETAIGWEWIKTKTTWAEVKKTGKRSLFSTVGAGREEYQVTIRRQALSLHQAMRWRGMFLFLSDLTMPDRGHIEAKTAMVEPVICTVRRTKVEKNELNNPTLTKQADVVFPACLTEKYAGFESGEVHDTTMHTFVAVCPKAIVLTAGEIVTIDSKPYRVQIGHQLSEYKNEYELTREDDC